VSTQPNLIGFDADDTLWHNESLFSLTQAKFLELLGGYHSPEQIERRLYETELRNLNSFEFDHVIVNDDLDAAAEELGNLVASIYGP